MTDTTKPIIFATGNNRKIIEANAALAPYGVTLAAQKVDVDEIQHHDPAEITKAKARAAYEVVGQPVVVSDTSWSIPALGGFPGGYMKDVANWWQAGDWLDVMASHDDKSLICMEHVTYYDGQVLRHFAVDYKGRFAQEARGKNSRSVSIEEVVILYGDTTLAEQLPTLELTATERDLRHWILFAEWLKSKPL